MRNYALILMLLLVSLVVGADAAYTPKCADGLLITWSSGAEVCGSIDAAPSTATYIMQTASSGTSAEQALSSLSSGCLSVTTGTGVIASSGAACGSSGANTALSNLASVAINTDLIPGTAGAPNLGSITKPWGTVILSGSSGTPGTNNATIGGAFTAGRTITVPDANDTLVGKATTDTLTNKTLNCAGTGNSCTNVSLATGVTGTLPVANGGTGITSGTSGGVLAFTASGTLASSGALTANLPVIGGGAGVAPTVGTRSGNTTAYVTTTGTQTSGDCVKIDANGNHVANGSACGGGSGTVTSLTPTDGLSNSDLTNTAVTTTGTIIRRASDLRAVQIEEEFCAPASVGVAQFKQVDENGTIVAWSPTASPITNNEPCAWTLTSGATSGNMSGVFLGDDGHNGIGALGDHTTSDVPWEAQFRFKLAATTNYVAYVGLGKWNTAVVPTDFMGLRFDTAGGVNDTLFQFVCIKAGASTSTTSTTITPASTNFYRLRVYSTVAGQVNFELLDNTGASLKSSLNICSTNNPSADLTLGFTVGTRTSSSQSMVIGAAGYTRVMAR